MVKRTLPQARSKLEILNGKVECKCYELCLEHVFLLPQ